MKVRLDEVINALEFVNSGFDCEAYFNIKTKEFICISDFSMYVSEEEREYIYEESISLPTKYEIDEYNMMEEFIETIDDERLYNQLYISLDGKGAFRRFKATCINYDIIDDWYRFRDKKYKYIAKKWCKDNNIKYLI